MDGIDVRVIGDADVVPHVDRLRAEDDEGSIWRPGGIAGRQSRRLECVPAGAVGIYDVHRARAGGLAVGVSRDLVINQLSPTGRPGRCAELGHRRTLACRLQRRYVAGREIPDPDDPAGTWRQSNEGQALTVGRVRGIVIVAWR